MKRTLLMAVMRKVIDAAMMKEKAGWENTPYCSQITPSMSMTCSKRSTPKSWTKASIASTSSREAIPMNRTWSPYCSWTDATAPASRRQVVHHGAQYQRMASVPSSEPKSICPPLTVGRTTPAASGAALCSSDSSAFADSPLAAASVEALVASSTGDGATVVVFAVPQAAARRAMAARTATNRGVR